MPAPRRSVRLWDEHSQPRAGNLCASCGQLQHVPAAITEVPTWDPTGSGPHSVAAEIEFCSSVVARGGVLLGTFDEEQTVGLAIIHPSFEPLLAWLAFLHVSRPYRRRGAAQARWDASVDISVAW